MHARPRAHSVPSTKTTVEIRMEAYDMVITVGLDTCVERKYITVHTCGSRRLLNDGRKSLLQVFCATREASPIIVANYHDRLLLEHSRSVGNFAVAGLTLAMRHDLRFAMCVSRSRLLAIVTRITGLSCPCIPLANRIDSRKRYNVHVHDYEVCHARVAAKARLLKILVLRASTRLSTIRIWRE